MYKTKIVLLSLFCGVLAACNTMHSQPSATDKKNIHTALVNTQLGMTYLQRNQPELAKQKLLMALELAPTIPEPWYSMAYYLETTGDISQANTYYLKAIALAPKSGEVHNNYGTFLCRKGDIDGSIQHFMTAIADPHYLDTASAYENAGLCALKIPNKQLAARYFNKALAHDSNLPTSLLELAKYAYSEQDYNNAREKLRQFLILSPPNSQSELLSAELGVKIGYLHSFDNHTPKVLSLHSTHGDVRWS
jgi:type IV pilus assembly protein PilF